MPRDGNPMRWDCDARGCFNRLKRPKLEMFAGCFDRGINFGDVDMLVEANDHFLLCEWKPRKGPLQTGQRLLHEAILRLPRFTIIVIHGDAESMGVTSFEVRYRTSRETVDGDLDVLRARIRAWFLWAERRAA